MTIAENTEARPDCQTEVRYSWIFRTSDRASWTLMLYRWTSRKDAINHAGHWLGHYPEVKPVEVTTEFRMEGDQRDVVSEAWRVIG